MLLYLVILVIIVYFAIKKKETFSSNIAIQKQSYRGCENDKFNEKLHNKFTPMPSNETDIPDDKIRTTILPENKTYNDYKETLTKFILKPLKVKSLLLDVYIEKDDIYDMEEFSYINNLVTIKLQQCVHNHMIEQPINKICTNLNHCLVKYIDSQLVTIAISPLKTKRYRFNYYFTISTHPFVYVLDITGIYVKDDTNLDIIDIKIIGMEPKDKHMPADANNNILEKFTTGDIDTDNVLEPFTNNNLLSSVELENKILSDKADIKKLVDDQKTDYNDRITRQYSCYKGKGNNEAECSDNKDLEGISKPPGVWDYKCMTNEECPFYKMNKNYPNERGGCINGMCEMPLNVKQNSPHTYSLDPKYRPYCHKCIGNDFRCCDLQNDKKIFNLDTPDYMFKKDYAERKINSERLNKMGRIKKE